MILESHFHPFLGRKLLPGLLPSLKTEVLTVIVRGQIPSGRLGAPWVRRERQGNLLRSPKQPTNPERQG